MSGVATPAPIDGAALLDEVMRFARRFIAYPDDDSPIAHTVWIAHAHLVGAFNTTPRLAVLSPEYGSGKTRVLEITELLVPRAMPVANATPAYVFRRIGSDADAPRPTLLLDEVDSYFKFGKSVDPGTEQMRALLNAGYRRGTPFGRVNPNTMAPEEFETFCAAAVAGIGNLPDSVTTRSVIIPMQRRRKGETVEPFRHGRAQEAEAHALRDRLEAWAAQVESVAAEAIPDLPTGIEDRAADVWEPLITVADLAGGSWPEAVRETAVRLVETAKKVPPSIGIRLLSDIRDIFLGERIEVLSVMDLISRLRNLDDAPWAHMGRSDEGIDAAFVAKLLRGYEVKTNTTVRINGSTMKGYRREWFTEAWDRYLDDWTPTESMTA